MEKEKVCIFNINFQIAMIWKRVYMCILLQYFLQYNLICNSLREKVCLIEENSSMYTSVKFDFIMKTACPKNE